ncbi:hypothetical protein [Halalkalicoccus salilacus]
MTTKPIAAMIVVSAVRILSVSSREASPLDDPVVARGGPRENRAVR